VSRGVKIAIAAVGVAVVAIAIVTFVMVEHVDDGTHTASKRVTPDRMERFDTIVVLKRDTSTAKVSDIEDRLNRVDAIEQYAELPRRSLTYLLSLDRDHGTKAVLDEACAQASVRGYAVALTKPAAAGREQVADALRDDAVVLQSRYEPSQPEIFMAVRAKPSSTSAVRTKLESDPDVVKYRFLDHQDAYDEFKRLFADQPDLLKAEPSDGSHLPESFRLDLRAGAALETVAARYRRMPGVQDIGTPKPTGVPTAVPFDVCTNESR
jgi:hypothetical protein